jgi:hypothetical protein
MAKTCCKSKKEKEKTNKLHCGQKYSLWSLCGPFESVTLGCIDNTEEPALLVK